MTKPPRRVVALIRKLVKRPQTLPKPVETLGKHKSCLRFNQTFCPLGLLPGALSPAPMVSFVKCGLPRDDIEAFMWWWDTQTDARAAVDAVWGKKTTAASRGRKK